MALLDTGRGGGPHALLVGLSSLEELGSPAGVVLPVQDHLVVQEPHTLPGHDLLPEGLVLEQLQEVETDGVLDVGHVGRLLPVHQVGEIVDEGGLLHVSSLSQEVKVVWVCERLDELQLDLEPELGLLVTLLSVVSVDWYL